MSSESLKLAKCPNCNRNSSLLSLVRGAGEVIHQILGAAQGTLISCCCCSAELCFVGMCEAFAMQHVDDQDKLVKCVLTNTSKFYDQIFICAGFFWSHCGFGEWVTESLIPVSYKTSLEHLDCHQYYVANIIHIAFFTAPIVSHRQEDMGWVGGHALAPNFHWSFSISWHADFACSRAFPFTPWF